MVVRHIVARVGRSRLVVGPCTACSLRSGVALALVILFFVPLSIVTKQEPQKTKQTRNLKSSTFTGMAHQHHHERFPAPSGCRPHATSPSPPSRPQLRSPCSGVAVASSAPPCSPAAAACRLHVALWRPPDLSLIHISEPTRPY